MSQRLTFSDMLAAQEIGTGAGNADCLIIILAVLGVLGVCCLALPLALGLVLVAVILLLSVSAWLLVNRQTRQKWARYWTANH